MTREEAIKILSERYSSALFSERTALGILIPELAESEDEKIRKGMIRFLNSEKAEDIFTYEARQSWVAWLEKQKEQKSITINQDEKEFLADEITAFLCNYDKEFDGEDPVPSEVAEHFYLLGKQAQEQKPVEWSEEDKKMLLSIINAFRNGAVSTIGQEQWLKSLPERFNLQSQAKQEQKEPSDKGEISDGYHTFNELYYYRLLYNAAFFNLLPKEQVHKSKRHHDGKECFGGGWFIVMANLPTGQISNHYEIKYWDLFHIPEKETADKWDGHTPQEAAERLHKFLLEKPDLMPAEYLPKEKINSIMSKLTNLSFSKLIPFNSEEYKKIDEITTDVFNLLDYPIEQKPVEWKPQPESLEALMYAIEGKWEMIKPTSYLSRRLEDLYDGLVNTYNSFTFYSAKDIEELKALKDKIDASMNEKPVEWSEEDEEMIEGIIGDLCALKDWIIKYDTNWLANPVLKNIDKRIAWLKSLKDRGNFPKSNTNSPSEWSEEDEAMRDNILRLLSCFVGTSECESNPSLSCSYPTYRREIEWLKSLRPVSKESLQPHWKPSEEQIEALSETIEFAPDTFKPKCTLVTLQYDLKKLMEE